MPSSRPATRPAGAHAVPLWRRVRLWAGSTLRTRRQSRVARWVVRGLLGLLVAGLLVVAVGGWLMTYTDVYRRIPARVWHRGGLDAIGAAGAVYGGENGRVLDSLRRTFNRDSLAAPQDVQAAAARWVQTVNAGNPGAVVIHDVDRYASLYLVIGAWWDSLDENGQLLVTHGLAAAWQEYLYSVYPALRAQQYHPALFLYTLDGRGLVAQNARGKVALLRAPVLRSDSSSPPPPPPGEAPLP